MRILLPWIFKNCLASSNLMNCLGRVVITMMLLLLVKLLLLVLMLVAMMLTPPTPLSHLFWSLFCPLCLQLLMSSTRASPMMRLLCWQKDSAPCTSFVSGGGDHLGAASSATTPPTSSPIAPRGRNLTPPTSTNTPSETTTARTVIRRSTASGTRRKRRTFRKWCPEHVLPSATLTSLTMTPLALWRMRRSSASQATSPAFGS
jgi:uncharacterized integral membrane protein